MSSDSSISSNGGGKNNNHNGVISKFVTQTYELVWDSTRNTPELAHWSKDGSYFTIVQPEAFSQTYLPKYFRHARFTSFVRQLNFYSFKKVKNDDIPPTTSYHHKWFHRDRPDDFCQIQRITRGNSSLKQKKARRASLTKATATMPSAPAAAVPVRPPPPKRGGTSSEPRLPISILLAEDEDEDEYGATITPSSSSPTSTRSSSSSLLPPANRNPHLLLVTPSTSPPPSASSSPLETLSEIASAAWRYEQEGITTMH